jgi:hypothetical protein
MKTVTIQAYSDTLFFLISCKRSRIIFDHINMPDVRYVVNAS